MWVYYLVGPPGELQGYWRFPKDYPEDLRKKALVFRAEWAANLMRIGCPALTYDFWKYYS